MTTLAPIRVQPQQPVELSAMRWTGENYAALNQWAGNRSDGHEIIATAPPGLMVWSESKQMWSSAVVNDWVVRGITGSFFVVRPHQFDATYTPATHADEWEPAGRGVTNRVAPIGDAREDVAFGYQLADELYPDEVVSAYRRYKANAAVLRGVQPECVQSEGEQPEPAPTLPSPDVFAAILEQLQLGNVIAALVGSVTALELVGAHDIGEASAFVREQIDAIINPPSD